MSAHAHDRQRWILGASAVATLVLSLAWYTHQPAVAASRSAAADDVQVHTALVTRRDVPVYLEGLGTAQAFRTATMTARVDGQLQSVAFTEGQMVKQGQLLAQIDPRPLQAALAQAVAVQAKDTAQLDSAKRDLARYETLAAQNLTSQQTLDAQRAQVAQLSAQLQVDAAAIDNARTQLEYTRVTAPFDGRTGIRMIDPGNNVHAGDTTGIVVVTQMQPIVVVFTLPEDQLLQVNDALAAGTVHAEALSRAAKAPLDSGTLTLVDNQIDQNTGSIRLKATFPNAHTRLWPGQFVSVRLLLKQQHDALTLPVAAIEHGPNGPFAYVIKADMSVEARPVQLGEEGGEVAVVTGGLAEGERVVTSNQYRLQPGTHVRIG